MGRSKGLMFQGSEEGVWCGVVESNYEGVACCK